MNEYVAFLFSVAKRRGITGVKWAKMAGIDRKTLYSIRYQHNNPGLATITKMGKALGFKLEWTPNA